MAIFFQNPSYENKLSRVVKLIEIRGMDAVVVNVSQVEYSAENFQNIQILV